MGKIRKEKRHKLRLKTPGMSTNPRMLAKKQEDPHGPLSKSTEVVPLPEEIMKSLPVLGLKGTEITPGQAGGSESDKGRTKREKRKIKKEEWLKSKLIIFNCPHCIIILTVIFSLSTQCLHFSRCKHCGDSLC